MYLYIYPAKPVAVEQYVTNNSNVIGFTSHFQSVMSLFFLKVSMRLKKTHKKTFATS